MSTPRLNGQNVCACGHRLSVHQRDPLAHAERGMCLAPACECNGYRFVGAELPPGKFADVLMYDAAGSPIGGAP